MTGQSLVLPHGVQDLIAAAAARGYSVTKRFVADWVSLGLLDKGTPRGRGQARGKDYRWSDNQLQLFLVLLDKHRTVSRPVLLNIPVSLWLIWGDNYVPLRQARRALATWAGANETVSSRKANATARRVIEGLDHPRATRSARRQLRELVEAVARGHAFERQELLNTARAVFDPNGNRPAAPPTAMTPETYLQVLEARLTATRRLREEGQRSTSGHSIPDEAFLAARQIYLTTGPTARMAAAPMGREAQLTAPPLLAPEAIVNAACVHLLTVLGVWLVNEAARRGP